MSRILGVALMVAVIGGLGLPTTAESLPAGCISAPLPTTPVAPIYTVTIAFSSSDQAQLQLWRQPCANNPTQLAALVRITPISPSPFVCAVNFAIIQDGIQFDGWIKTSQTSLSGFCSDLFVAQTFLFLESPTQASILNAAGAFTLIHKGVAANQLLEVPAAGVQPPPPLSVVVVATGCTTCHSSQVVAYEMHFTNPGAAMAAEIKGGARLPDGSILPLANQVTTLPSGASVLPLVPAQALPGGLPTIDLLIEAAILEPALGVTLSRHNVTLHLLP